MKKQNNKEKLTVLRFVFKICYRSEDKGSFIFLNKELKITNNLKGHQSTDDHVSSCAIPELQVLCHPPSSMKQKQLTCKLENSGVNISVLTGFNMFHFIHHFRLLCW